MNRFLILIAAMAASAGALSTTLMAQSTGRAGFGFQEAQALAQHLAGGTLDCGIVRVRFTEVPGFAGMATDRCEVLIPALSRKDRWYETGVIAHEVAHLKVGIGHQHDRVFVAMQTRLDDEIQLGRLMHLIA